MSSSSEALSNIRAAVIIIVVAFHSMLAYLGSLPRSPARFGEPPYRWVTFPIIDSERWFGFDLFCALQNLYLMSFMFLLSGLFVWPSLKRKGATTFVRGRLLRLGVPAAIGMGLLMPMTHFATYRVTTLNPSLLAFWRDWLALPFWPTGPIWFIWQLLALDLVVAILWRFAPRSGEFLARSSASGVDCPARYFFGLAAVSATAYAPLALLFGPWEWWQVGPVAVQSSRPLLYAVYFFAGVGIGAYGLDRGLFATDGMLARRWTRWLLIALTTFVVWIIVTAIGLERAETVPIELQLAAALAFVSACAAGCFAFAAVFLRYATRRSSLLRSLSEYAFGIYLVHYAFVVWLQYALLSIPLWAPSKGDDRVRRRAAAELGDGGHHAHLVGSSAHCDDRWIGRPQTCPCCADRRPRRRLISTGVSATPVAPGGFNTGLPTGKLAHTRFPRRAEKNAIHSSYYERVIR